MNVLSIFIDESGDFGTVKEWPAYYLVTLVFHEQADSIVEPKKYRLLQAADFICSIELLKLKRELKCLSKSEEKFFYKSQELKKTFIKMVEKKRL